MLNLLVIVDDISTTRKLFSFWTVFNVLTILAPCTIIDLFSLKNFNYFYKRFVIFTLSCTSCFSYFNSFSSYVYFACLIKLLWRLARLLAAQIRCKEMLEKNRCYTLFLCVNWSFILGFVKKETFLQTNKSCWYFETCLEIFDLFWLTGH